MVLKTFNLDHETFKKFSEHCKKEGISMSKRVDKFIREQVAQIENPEQALQPTKPLSKEEHPMHKYC